MNKTAIGAIVIATLFILAALLTVNSSKTDTKTPISQLPPTTLPNVSVTPKTAKTEPQLTQTKKSADGTVSLTITSQKQNDGYTHYIFSTKNKDGLTTKVYDTTESSLISFAIHHNSWSPDNKQFLIEKSTPGKLEYLVFKGDGTNYSNDLKYLDILGFWTSPKNSLTIDTITGWAGNDLVVVYTKKTDGTDGPSFWFFTSTHKFSQLSS